MLSGARMRLIAMMILLTLAVAIEGKSKKKSIKDEVTVLNKKLINKVKPSPAIIAIEIVDPNENKTSKNSKRTIESSLGYGGYNSHYSSPYHPSPPRYEVYKYSQHDIPAYQGNTYSSYSSGGHAGGIGHQYQIQKSIEYRLPTQTQVQNLNQYYQPGTTLYSTINTHGQVAGLSSHIPSSLSHQHGGYNSGSNLAEPHVPVIILRVYPNQLTDPGAALHPNLPQNHPLASTINSLDIQSLLSKYVQNILLQRQQSRHHQQPQQYVQSDNNNNQYHQQYYQPAPAHQEQYVQQQDTSYHQQYQQQHDQVQDYPEEEQLLTHENYPKDTHTRVYFKPKQPTPVETKTIQIQVPENTFSSVEVQGPETVEQPQSQGGYYYNDDVMQSYMTYQHPQEAVPAVPVEEKPFNYHAHQKRNNQRHRQKTKKIVASASTQEAFKLDPIKAA